MIKYIVFIFSLALVGCSDHLNHPQDAIHGQVGAAVAAQSKFGNNAAKAGPTTPVSGGPNQTGVVVPTAQAIIGRILNGLESNVSVTAGSFAQGIAQVRTNLPKVADVRNAAGFDQVQLLAYSACSDLTRGNPSRMQSVYNVNPGAPVATNQPALVAAGMRMLDQHTANIASEGPVAAQLSTIFTNVVQQAIAATNTSTIAFMTVCIAANTAGAAMLGL